MKKNKIILITIICIVVIISAVVSFLYLKTDIFKSNKELFFKYISQTKLIEPELLENYKNLFSRLNNSNSSSSGNVSFSMASDNNDTNISNVQQLVSLKFNTLKNTNLKQNYTDITVHSNNQDLATLRFLRDDNVYGVKLENVLAKYIAVENNNLKDFAKKLGIADVSNVPDSIQDISPKEIIFNDKETITRFIEKYKDIFVNSIDSSDIVKTNNPDGTETLTLTLSQAKTKNIIVRCLENVKNDQGILNYIIEKANIYGYTLNIDSLRTSIQEQIDEINNSVNTENNDFLNLSVTNMKNKTTNISIKLQMDNVSENNSISSNLNNQEKIEIILDLSLSNKVIAVINYNDKDIYRADFSFEMDSSNLSTTIDAYELDEQKNIVQNLGKLMYRISNFNTNDIIFDSTISINNGTDNGNLQINLNNSTQIKQDIEIEKITNQNAEILNNKTQKELQNLYVAIIKRIKYVYGDDILNNLSIFDNILF